MDQRERANDWQESFRASLEGHQAELWTALPAIVQSFDSAKQVAVAQPAVQARVRDLKGNFIWVTLPLLLDVPVVFPSGGGFTLTFPLKAGDEVLVVFSSRCIDGWWQLGGVQRQLELRMHDLSDGFALPSPRSQVKLLTGGVDATKVQLRSDDGTTKVEVTPDQKVQVTAPGGLYVTGDLHVTGLVVATGEGTFNGGHTVSAHVHGGVQAGGSSTATPTG